MKEIQKAAKQIATDRNIRLSSALLYFEVVAGVAIVVSFTSAAITVLQSSVHQLFTRIRD
jgi:hypothetical protein